MKKSGKIIVGILLFFAVLLVFTAFWVPRTFGNVTVEEMVFTMLVPQTGMNLDVIYSFILEALLGAVVLGFILYYLLLWEDNKFWKWIFGMKCFRDGRFKYPFKSGFVWFLILVIFGGSLMFTLGKLKIFDYLIEQFTYSDFIEREYVDAREVNLDFGDKKRNLIYIYLESMENTYADKASGGVMVDNLIQELAMLSDSYISFSNTDKLGGAQSVPGSTWTTGAMVAQTSGLPLRLSLFKESYMKYGTFLADVYTLGDVLRDNGYRQIVMFGSDASFGGRDSYFREHGYYEIYDVEAAIKDGRMREDGRVWWGFEDKNLFAWAKEELLEISKYDEPFNFTMLTVDTHFEDGYLSDSCDRKYDNQYSNVIACSSKMVGEFVKWIQEQEFYKDTTIVIVGDHLSMDADYFENVDKDYVRTTYNVFINSVVDTGNVDNRVFTTMDLYPSTMAAMGIKIDGDRLGLGTNLFSNRKTLAEEYGIDKLKNELRMNSRFYNDKLMYNKDIN